MAPLPCRTASGLPMNHVIRSTLYALALTACSTIVGETPVETIEASTTTTATTVTTTVTSTTTTTVPLPAPRDCRPVSTGTAPVAAGSVAGVALLLSSEIFPCADDVVVVPATNLNDVATAAQLAAALGGPLLHPHPQLAAELARLEPLRIHLIGEVEVVTPRDSQVLRPNTSTAVEMARRALDVPRRYVSRQYPIHPPSSRPSAP